MKKRWIALLLALAMCLTLGACDDEDWEDEEALSDILNDEDFWDDDDFWEGDDYGDEETDHDWGQVGTLGDPDQTWSIYWYLCGSDLESEYGAATDDLFEMMEVNLPENVNVIIETGGAWMWMNDFVDESLTERYLYSSEGLELVDQQPMANMGEADTLADFLSFCDTNFPADRTMAIIWNHGGGSVSGAAFDENYDYDQLTLSEFYEAFDAVYDLSLENPPLDVIGFDACLMATVDTAFTFADVAEYMVASEEFEPGSGWYYEGWLQALADQPGMDGAMLGQAICDTYLEECRWNMEAAEATLSVVDLSEIGPLLQAYEAMGAEALTHALVNPGFFSTFSREAEATENYGGNTRDQGYANLLDLGHLAENCEELLPASAEAVRDGLERCVVYQVNGMFRENATGLSCYYSFNGDLDDFYGYCQEGCSDSFKALYNYGLGGEITQEEIDYINSIGFEFDNYEELPELPTLDSAGDYEYPLYIDDEGYVVMELDMDTLNMLKGVYFKLAIADEEEDIMILLGQDNDIEADWDTGIFRDNFRGVWGAIDGYPVYMEVYYEGEDYTAYAVPILLNDEEYTLRVAYDYNDQEYYILGARKGLDDNGMADKNLIQLRPGDTITTIHYIATMTGDDDFEGYAMDEFQVTEDTSFGEVDMGDGEYLMMFELVDARNQSAWSELVKFTVEGDYYDVEIVE